MFRSYKGRRYGRGVGGICSVCTVYIYMGLLIALSSIYYGIQGRFTQSLFDSVKIRDARCVSIDRDRYTIYHTQ